MHSLASALQATGSCQTLMLEDVEVDDEQALHSLKQLFEDDSCKLSHLELNSLGMSESTALQLIASIKKLKTLRGLSL